MLARVRQKNPESFKKVMWFGILEEFNCKATSTWSKCGRTKESAFTHKQTFEKKNQEETLSHRTKKKR